MLAPIVLAILVAHAPVTAQAGSTQQPPASPQQPAPEQPWPPAGVVRADADSGVTAPRPIKRVVPNYTSDAMRAGVHGTLRVEAVVEIDGTVGEVRVVRSLDKKHGQDEEAVRTVREWLFAPGTKDGVAVPVLIWIDMTFTQR